MSALASASAGHTQTLDRVAPRTPKASLRSPDDELQVPGEALSPEPKGKEHASLMTLGDAAVEIPHEHRLGKPVLLGALAVAALAAGYYLLPSRAKSRPGPTPVPAVSRPTPAPTPPPVQPIQVRITVEPREASLVLDGQPIPNPYARAQLPDPGTHTLTIKAEGRREESRSVVFDRDVDLTVVMLEAPPVAPAPAPLPEKRPSGEQTGHRGQRARAAGKVPKVEPVQAPSWPSELAPKPVVAPGTVTAPEKSVYRGTRLPLDSEF